MNSSYSVQKWLGIIRLPKQPLPSSFLPFSPKLIMNPSSLFDTSSSFSSSAQQYEYKYLSISNQAYERLMSIQFQENYNTLGYKHLVRLDYDFPGTAAKISKKFPRPFSLNDKRDKIDIERLAKFFFEERYKNLVDMLLDIKSRDDKQTENVLNNLLRIYLPEDKDNRNNNDKTNRYNNSSNNSSNNGHNKNDNNNNNSTSGNFRDRDKIIYPDMQMLTGTIDDDEKYDSDVENKLNSNTLEKTNSTFTFGRKGQSKQKTNKNKTLEEPGLEMDLFAIGVENKANSKNCRYILSKDVEAYKKRISDLERQVLVMKNKIREDELRQEKTTI